MARPKKPDPRARLNIELTSETIFSLESLKVRMRSRSSVETISRSVALVEALYEAAASGAEIVIRVGDKEQSLLIIPGA
jgi:hypothetical protein